MIKQLLAPMLASAAVVLAGCSGDTNNSTNTNTNNSTDFQGITARHISDSTPHWVDPPIAKPGSPNVVVILLDDAGFSDFGSFGAEIDTPNIDQLADNGLRYNNFTTTAVCSPSRAALLTGLNHHSAGVGWLANMDTGFPGYRGEIHQNAVTLPEVLKENGYNTLMVGKWHLINSAHLSVTGPYDSWPTQRGFERYWGFLDGESNQFTPAYLYAGNEVIQTELSEDFYFPEAMTDKAIQMLKDQRATSRSKPFFLYYASGGPHAPHHTLPEDRAKYRGKYDQGYDATRAARLAKQKALGIAPENTDLTGYYPGVTPWKTLTDDDRKVSARLQENYAAYVDQLDQQIGRLVDYLRKSGELDNTLIIVTSDNGGSKESGVPGTTMATRYLHGIPDTTEKNLEDFDLIGGPDSHPNYPNGWMQVSNTPFKYAKATTHGGGMRNPLIIHWPAGINKNKGAVRTQFHHINDLMPTILEATEIEHPEQYRGRAVKPMEGTSMAYTFTNDDSPGRKASQYYELAANRAFVEDGWKIVTYVPRNQPYNSVAWELYNLNKDFSEAHNLAEQYPEKVKALETKWWAAAEQYDVLPVDDRPIMKKGAASMKRKKNLRYKHFSYPPGINTIHNIQAPTLIGQPFSISAKLNRSSQEQGGVIVAQGGYDVGYTLFVKENRLNYEVNIGGYRTSLASTEELPTGDVAIRASFKPSKRHENAPKAKQKTDGDFSAHHLPQGIVTLYINDQPAGSKHFAPPVPFNSWEGLDIGLDRRTPVSKAYQAPFAFEGEIESVNYDIL